MTHYATLQKSKITGLKSPAHVVSIRSAGKKYGQHHEPKHGKKLKVELPQFNNERIFKPKEYDPL